MCRIYQSRQFRLQNLVCTADRLMTRYIDCNSKAVWHRRTMRGCIKIEHGTARHEEATYTCKPMSG